MVCPGDASIYYEALAVGMGVPGGMGGAMSPQTVWVHPRLSTYEPAILAVLAGEQSRVAQ
jgi:hypothetical protein